MAESPVTRPAKPAVAAAGVLFVIGTLAWLFVVYVVAINVMAAFREGNGDWTQSLFAIVPAVIVGIVALIVRSRLLRPRNRQP